MAEKKSKKKSLFIPACLLMVLLGALTGLLGMAIACGDLGLDMFKSYFAHPWLLVVNLIVPVALCLFFYMIFGRPSLGYFFGGGISLAAAIAQSIKIKSCRDVIYLTDFFEGGEGFDAFPALKDTDLGIGPVLAAVFFIAVTVLLILMFRGRGSAWFGGRMLLAVAIAGFLALYCANLHGMDKYDTSRYDLDNTASIDTRSDMQVYVSEGFYYPLAKSLFRAEPDEAPGEYSRARAAELIADYSDAAIPEGSKADIFVIQLESFADFSALGSSVVDMNDIYAELPDIKAGSVSGKALSYYFGQDWGGSASSILTGYTMPVGITKRSESYVRYLDRQGYDCWGMHPDYPDIWGVARRNRALGFESFGYIGDRFSTIEQIKGKYESDWYLFGQAYDEYVKRAESGQPQLAFIQTTQNMPPYGSGKPYAAEIAGEGISADNKAVLGDYFGGVRNTLFYLGNFLDRMKLQTRPVVVLICSDNMPDLGAENYYLLGLPDPYAKDAAFYDRYYVDYYIWANDAAKSLFGNKFSGAGPTISMNYVMQELFARCGYTGSVFMQLSQQIRKEFLFITPERMGFYGDAGKILYAKDLSLAQQTKLYNYLYLEYYSRHR